MFVKLSLLWFYLRLDQRGFMKWAVYTLSFVVLGLSISSFLILTFSCFPPAKFWDLTGTLEGHCMSPNSQQAFYEANGILTIVTDVLIYLTPIPMLWRVQINKVIRVSRAIKKEFCSHYTAQEDRPSRNIWTWNSLCCRFVITWLKHQASTDISKLDVCDMIM